MSFMFNAADEPEDKREFDTPPEGEYEVIITEIELKDTKKGNGKGIPLTLTIVGDSPYANRKFWEYWLYEHPSETAQNIGRQMLKRVCLAVGKPEIENLEELCYLPFKVYLKVKKEEWDGEMREKNFISRVVDTDNPPPQPVQRVIPKGDLEPDVPQDDDLPF